MPDAVLPAAAFIFDADYHGHFRLLLPRYYIGFAADISLIVTSLPHLLHFHYD